MNYVKRFNVMWEKEVAQGEWGDYVKTTDHERVVGELRSEIDALRSSQTLIGYRWRHSANEKWQFSDIPCGWEYEPVYAAIKEQAE